MASKSDGEWTGNLLRKQARNPVGDWIGTLDGIQHEELDGELVGMGSEKVPEHSEQDEGEDQC